MRRILLLALLSLTAVLLVSLLVTRWGSAFSRTAAADGAAGISTNAIKALDGCTANSLAPNDDQSTGSVALPFTANFFGTTYDALYVNNNGNVTFDGPLSSFTPFDLTSTDHVIIAPFFADVDTRVPFEGPAADVVTYGQTTYGGRAALCVNWVDVGFFSRRVDKLNSFQLLLVDRSDVGVGDFDIIFNYDQIQWETGEFSGGVDGLGGSSARVGYSNGVDTSLELPGSAVNGAFLDSSPSGLIHDSRNSLESGRYVFPVRSGTAPTGGTISGHVFGDTTPGGGGSTALAGALVQICLVGGSCNTTTTNALGEYAVSGLLPGQYVGSAFPPAGSDLFPGTVGPITLPVGETLTGQDFFLTQPGPLPPGVTISSISTTATGAPVINWATSNQVTTENTPGCVASYQVIKDGVAIQSGQMTEISPGSYKGTIPPLRPQHGPAIIRITVTCPDPADSKTIDIDVYIDPSGNVRTVGGVPIAGATVTLFRSDSSGGPFAAVPDGDPLMAPSNRNNPDTTDAEGYFHWDVFAGFYVVRAAAAGCVSPDHPAQPFVETKVLEIPPEVTGLDLRLDCGEELPTPTPAPTATPTPPAIVFGDANCNGSVDSIDAALVLQFGAGLFSSLSCEDGADVNEDGNVNSIDAALILQHVAGLLSSLPV